MESVLTISAASNLLLAQITPDEQRGFVHSFINQLDKKDSVTVHGDLTKESVCSVQKRLAVQP